MNKIFPFLFLLFCFFEVQAKVILPAVIGNNMVLQRQTIVNLWGKAKSCSSISITTSWDGKTYTALASSDGTWSTQVSTPKAGGPFSIVFNDGEETKVDNVMSGEVWLCSGQSNMEMPMQGFIDNEQFVDGADKAISSADINVPIRMFTHEHVADNARVHDEYESKGSWGVNESSTVATTSAVAYYFARYLQQQLNVPIGIIISAWSGSNITQWLSAEASMVVQDKFPSFDKNCVIYNGMVSTLLKVKFKGMIWYQGEANVNNAKEDEPALYHTMMPAFVNDLRKKFDCGDFPFYYVQIAPFNYNSEDNASARFREMQEQLMDEISNVGMATTVDVGDASKIHPAQKEVVALRLAYWALAKTYGMGNIVYESPRLSNAEMENGYAYLYFSNVQGGLYSKSRFISDLEMAGADKKFYKASGYVDAVNKRLVVYCDKFCHELPVAVRYCFKDFAIGSLYNEANLPVLPFRTDSW